jgi:MFS transporter, DHA1 family, solute carrier family 18 (vesicular amine transporter), member 1/2
VVWRLRAFVVPPVTPLRRSRAVAVAFVTFATFADIVAYSIAVPVLPDLSRRLGASPTVIGFLFASFGVTLLTVSLPMGAVSDRIGRKTPMVAGLAALAAATLIFAFSDTLPWLFAARLVQGAADAVTWVVGFALIADRYGVEERGRVTGIVMSGTSFAFMIGPSIGGWLYELGGIRLPFLAVTALAAVAAALFVWIDLPRPQTQSEPVPLAAVLRLPAVAACTVAVVAASSTLSMLEPVLALHLGTLGIGPARIGILFGIAATVNAMLHPVFGRMADRWGARRMMLLGLGLAAFALAALGQTWSFRSAIAFQLPFVVTMAMMITPSLAFMAEATSLAGVESFGVAYGVYNMAWGAGLLGGPAVGGFAYERVGFASLAIAWGLGLVAVSAMLARTATVSRERPQPQSFPAS